MLDQDEINGLRRLMELRRKRDETDAAAKEAKREYGEAEYELFEKLSEGALGSLSNVDLGPPWGKVSFRPRETYYGQPIKGMEDELIAWFKARGMLDEVSKLDLSKKRMNELARAAQEGDGEMPDGLDFRASRGVTVTIQKGQ